MKYLIGLVALGCVTGTTYGAIRIFFDKSGARDDEPILRAPAYENPVLARPGGRLYVWAQMIPDPPTQKWNGIGLNFKIDGGTITAWDIYNYENPPGDGSSYVRWQGVGLGSGRDRDGDGRYDEIRNANMVAVVIGEGVNNRPPARQFDQQYTGWLRQSDTLPQETLLGFVDFFDTGRPGAEIFVGVGTSGIVRQGTTVPQDIYLGFGDEGCRDPFNPGYSCLPDAYIFPGNRGGLNTSHLPEPQTLSLIVLGVLLAGRRASRCWRL